MSPFVDMGIRKSTHKPWCNPCYKQPGQSFSEGLLEARVTRIGLIQMQCGKGEIQNNLDRIGYHLEEASARGVEILAFPEMSLTGYADPTRYPEAILRLDGPEVVQLLKLTERYSAELLVGLIERNPAGKPFITQIVARQGVLQGYYRKMTIRNDETDWFSPGQEVPVFQLNGLTFGIAICADIQNEGVFARCVQDGAKIVFAAAAPGLSGEQAARNWQVGYSWWADECERFLSHYANAYGVWIVVATQAGRTVDEDFPGGGYVFAPSGERVFATPDWLPGAVYLALDFESGQIVQL